MSELTTAQQEIQAKAPSVCTYMNNGHRNSLAYLVTHHQDLLTLLTSNQVVMQNLSAESIEIGYTTRQVSSPIEKGEKTATIPFYPYLTGYDQVRSRLVNMAQTSERVVTSRKPIIIYSFPKQAVLITSLLVLFVFSIRSNGVLPFLLGEKRNQLCQFIGGQDRINTIVINTVKIHIVEAVAMMLVSFWKGASIKVTAQWTITLLYIGFPTWFRFFAVNSHKRALRRSVFGVDREFDHPSK